VAIVKAFAAPTKSRAGLSVTTTGCSWFCVICIAPVPRNKTNIPTAETILQKFAEIRRKHKKRGVLNAAFADFALFPM
jgi:tRNA A37 methylthiotransferase MiaB